MAASDRPTAKQVHVDGPMLRDLLDALVDAVRQSLRLRVPEVREPVPFAEAVRDVGESAILLHIGQGLDPLEAVLRSPARLFVGPEGGWSEEEIRLARETGLAFAQLGPYRLRSETAGIVAVARARAALMSRNGAERS